LGGTSETRVDARSEQADPSGPPILAGAPPRRKWTLRRTLSLVLIVSGLFWLAAGFIIHLLF
jgi:hypothetical protein